MASDTVQLNPFAVRALRQARGMKQQTVATLAEISVSYYSELESGVKQFPSREVLLKLMDALGLRPEDERAITRYWLASELDDPDLRAAS